MVWVKVDDAMPEHPKLLDTTYPALTLALQTAALCYCNRHLTDGFLPRAKADSLIPLDSGGKDQLGFLSGVAGTDATWAPVIADLVAAGIWEEADGGYIIHDYLDYQPSRAEVHAKRVKEHEAKVKAGQQRAKEAGRSAGGTFTRSEPAAPAEEPADAPAAHQPRTRTRTRTKDQEKKPVVELPSDIASDVIAYLNTALGLPKPGQRGFTACQSNARLIHARAREGATLDDFKTVIDNQVRAWRDNGEMSPYLRPTTLFSASKFEGYLNAQRAKSETVAALEGKRVL